MKLLSGICSLIWLLYMNVAIIPEKPSSLFKNVVPLILNLVKFHLPTVFQVSVNIFISLNFFLIYNFHHINDNIIIMLLLFIKHNFAQGNSYFRIKTSLLLSHMSFGSLFFFFPLLFIHSVNYPSCLELCKN